MTPPEKRAALKLQDGRQLAWSEWGPADGIPVLFCTGAGMSSWLGFGAGDLASLNLRLICIDRPGLGSSDPHARKTLSSWADDVEAFIHANALGPVLAVGFSQGSVFALALAWRGLVDAIAIVSGQDELTHPSFQSLLHPDVAVMVTAAQQDPMGFEQRFAQMATADGLWQLIMGMSAPCDRQLYESDAFGAAYRQALQEGFAQGS
ncbi:MAG TPA: alpha/beta hydrolase [Trichocoleus sp.]